MTLYQKNIFVGLTVVAALVILGVMIMKFGDAPAAWIGPARVEVAFKGPRADGLSPGSAVYYLGADVGSVTQVEIQPGGTEVVVRAMVDKNKHVPANVVGFIKAQLIGNTSAISLEPAELPPTGSIADVHVVLPMVWRGTDLLPPQFTELAEELRKTTQQFRESNLVAHLDEAVQTVQLQVTKAGTALDSINQLVSDPKMRDDVKAAVDHIRVASENADKITTDLQKFSDNLHTVSDSANTTIVHADVSITKTQGHIDDLSKQVADRLEQISKTLDNFNSITAKIDKGEGTAGLLVNDPKLYQGLVDTTAELKATIGDLKLLIDQWTEEGAHIKLGGK